MARPRPACPPDRRRMDPRSAPEIPGASGRSPKAQTPCPPGLVACGSARPASQVSSTSAHATARTTTGTSPSTIPSPAPLTSSYGVLVSYPQGTGPSNGGYDIAIVDVSAKVVARAHAAPRSFIRVSGISAPAAVDLPEVSTSNSRLYYLDGDTQVRSLSVNGSTAAVTRIAGGPYSHAGFAVSRMIAESRSALSTIRPRQVGRPGEALCRGHCWHQQQPDPLVHDKLCMARRLA